MLQFEEMLPPEYQRLPGAEESTPSEWTQEMMLFHPIILHLLYSLAAWSVLPLSSLSLLPVRAVIWFGNWGEAFGLQQPRSLLCYFGLGGSGTGRGQQAGGGGVLIEAWLLACMGRRFWKAVLV